MAVSVAVTMTSQPMSGQSMWKNAIFGSADITQQSRTDWAGEPISVKYVQQKFSMEAWI